MVATKEIASLIGEAQKVIESAVQAMKGGPAAAQMTAESAGASARTQRISSRGP